MPVSIIEAIYDEFRAARDAARPVLHVRVSLAAIPGSVITTPLSPERARALRPYVIHLQGRDTPDALADPEVVERALELVLHPEDWARLLADHAAIPDVALPLRDGEPFRVLGVPVTPLERL